jgi:glycosyltransferase involved in cell wall biosynthesis
MSNMDIAILMPVRNGFEFLPEAVASVVQQTYPHWHLYIGVNGHGEEAAVLATALAAADPTRIHVYIQPPTVQSKVDALNHLMSTAVKDEAWICLLDCDDRWAPTKLAEQVEALQQNAAEATVIGTWCRYFGDATCIPLLPAGCVDPSVLQHVNPLINSSVMLRRSWARWEYPVLADGPCLLEDYYLWMRIAQAGCRLYNVPRILVDHRIHQGSAFNSQHLDPAPLQRMYRAYLKSGNS